MICVCTPAQVSGKSTGDRVGWTVPEPVWRRCHGTRCRRGGGVLNERRRLQPTGSQPPKEVDMQIGLLWFDNDPHRALANKIEDAARRYGEKFGRPADTCYVNSMVLNGGLAAVTPPNGTLRVVPAANVLPHHFWVGEDGAS